MSTSIAPATKVCRYCGVGQPFDSFEVCRTTQDKVYRRLKCRACKQQCATDRRRKIRHWLNEFKKALRCVRCGFADYRALEFHHEDGAGKDFNVADMVKDGLSISRLKREIAKCQILCANCHRIEHFDERP
jgi:hypothetical protein